MSVARGSLEVTAVALAAAVVCGCGAHFQPVDLTTLPTPMATSALPWEVLLEERIIRVLPEGDTVVMEIRSRHRQRLTRPGSLPDIVATYDHAFSALVSLHARTLLPDGTSHDLDEKDRRDSPAFSGSALYTNDRVVRWRVPPLPVGAVLEFESVTRSTDPRAWMEWVSFGGPAIRLARLRVEAPAGVEVGFVPSAPAGAKAPVLRPVAVPSGKAWVWEERDLAELSSETFGPPAFTLAPQVLVRLERWPGPRGEERAFASADELAHWLFERQRERLSTSDDMRATVARELKGVPDEPRARARALYEYVCRAVQYCAIEIGYGGWLPHAAKDVHGALAGDCKDKANYLQALLAVAGVDSELALVYSHRGVPVEFALPSLGGNFNHAILAVRLGDGFVYADPTWRAVPFGQLPWTDSDAPTLHVAKGEGLLRRTPPQRPEQNQTSEVYRLAPLPEGGWSGHFELTARGNDGVEATQARLDRERTLKDWAANRLNLRHARVDEVAPVQGGDFDELATVRGEVHGDTAPPSTASGTQVLRMTDLLNPALFDLDPGPRATPFVCKWPWVSRATVHLTLPSGQRATTVPPASVVDSPLGRFEVAWTAVDGGLTLERTLRFERCRVPVADWEALQDFARQVRQTEASAVVLQREGASR